MYEEEVELQNKLLLKSQVVKKEEFNILKKKWSRRNKGGKPFWEQEDWEEGKSQDVIVKGEFML